MANSRHLAIAAERFCLKISRRLRRLLRLKWLCIEALKLGFKRPGLRESMDCMETFTRDVIPLTN